MRRSISLISSPVPARSAISYRACCSRLDFSSDTIRACARAVSRVALISALASRHQESRRASGTACGNVTASAIRALPSVFSHASNQPSSVSAGVPSASACSARRRNAGDASGEAMPPAPRAQSRQTTASSEPGGRPSSRTLRIRSGAATSPSPGKVPTRSLWLGTPVPDSIGF